MEMRCITTSIADIVWPKRTDMSVNTYHDAAFVLP